MSNLEHDSLVSKIEQLERQQQVLTKYIATTKRQLDELSEQFNNRPELEQLAELKDALAQLHQQLDASLASSEVPVEVVSETAEESQQQLAQARSSEYQLVFDRSGSRAVLLEALEQAQERLIIVCPWLNRNSIDADLMQKFRDCLNRNCRIEIGWGHLSDRNRIGIGWRYNALKDLRQLEQDYPEFFSLKLLGTHEKFLVCDSTFAMLGSHNLLTSSAQSAEREVGIRTTDPNIIQGLLARFDDTEVQDAPGVDESLLANWESFVDVEAPLDVQDIGEESDSTLMIPNEEEIEEDTDDSVEDDWSTAIDAEEFWRKFNNREWELAGINLARIDLTGKNLGCDNLNLSKANLTRAKLGKARLDCINLSGANLKGADLYEARLHQTNLNEANLENADLRRVVLYGTKLVKANLSRANLSEVNLNSSVGIDLTGAILSRSNLCRANLKNIKLTNVDLSYANLSHANLLGANLEDTNLQGVNLQQAVYNSTTVFPLGFDPIKAGAYLIAPDTSLPNANLAGIDLNPVNLTGADLRGANLNSTNLFCADLSEANLSGAKLVRASLNSAKLLQVNLGAANLSEANLDGANLSGAILKEAKLSGAVMPDGTVHS